MPVYDAFNIIVHGSVFVFCDFAKRETTIVFPYNMCHQFYAIVLDANGGVVKSLALQRSDYQIPNLSSPGGLSHPIPDNAHLWLTSGIKGIGPNVFATISGLPLPEYIRPWGRYTQRILDPSKNAYNDNTLSLVDVAGVPSIYVLQFSQQSSSLQMNGAGGPLAISPTRGTTGKMVGRLHVYAESVTDDAMHNAWPTLDAAIDPTQDLDALQSKATPNLKKAFVDDSAEVIEQLPLSQVISVPPPPTCKVQVDFHPRTCIPVVGSM